MQNTLPFNKFKSKQIKIKNLYIETPTKFFSIQVSSNVSLNLYQLEKDAYKISVSTSLILQ